MSGSEGLSRWIPLESNPEVLNSWSKKAGLITSQAQFEDVYGLDSELLAMVPQPVKAVILLFPITEHTERKRREEQAKLADESTRVAIDPTVFYIKQTISNACGTIGLIHALANSNVAFAPESPMQKFIDKCKDKTPLERAYILETTPLFAQIHSTAAQSGQTSVPTNLDTNLHFTCFVQAPLGASRDLEAETDQMRLVELDGRRDGPLDRGPCTDLLQDAARIVKEEYMSGSSSMQFSMMALAPPA